MTFTASVFTTHTIPHCHLVWMPSTKFYPNRSQNTVSACRNSLTTLNKLDSHESDAGSITFFQNSDTEFHETTADCSVADAKTKQTNSRTWSMQHANCFVTSLRTPKKFYILPSERASLLRMVTGLCTGDTICLLWGRNLRLICSYMLLQRSYPCNACCWRLTLSWSDWAALRRALINSNTVLHGATAWSKLCVGEGLVGIAAHCRYHPSPPLHSLILLLVKTVRSLSRLAAACTGQTVAGCGVSMASNSAMGSTARASRHFCWSWSSPPVDGNRTAFATFPSRRLVPHVIAAV